MQFQHKCKADFLQNTHVFAIPFSQRTLIASAVLSALAVTSHPVYAETGEVQTVTVTSSAFGKDESLQILNPSKVLAGPELRSKVGSSLGETLGGELGVSASGFGAGASRPIIRGLEGPRVKILQNGMSVADVSTVSNDHAVASESSTAQQIEVLRGPAALLYGSGAIGGLVNVVDNRIPTTLSKTATGEAELRLGSVNQEKSLSFSTETSAGDVALHLDGNTRNTADYRIPGHTDVADPSSPSGKLPTSFTREQNLTFGANLIQQWGHFGAAIQTLKDHYGIPTDERSFIDLRQNRIDLDTALNKPFDGFNNLQLKISGTDYQHTEKAADGTASTRFSNRELENRLTIAHDKWQGWEGNWGIQNENSRFSALSAETGRADTVPTTISHSTAGFIVEQKQFGEVAINLGSRLENVKRNPSAQFLLPSKSYTLSSSSIGAQWQFAPAFAAGVSISSAQRAPTTEELYSNGPHESTATFDIGNNNLRTENSRNLEFSLQKTSGLLRWKVNAFVNKIKHFVYGRIDGLQVDEAGLPDLQGEFTQRFFSQGDATIHGGEAEISYNERGEGFSYRAYADTSKGKLDQQGSLPLQPASRIGLEIGYKHAGWRHSLNILHAEKQDRLASFEKFVTPSYTRVDLDLTYSHPYGNTELTWFLQGKNLFNQDIRLATSLLKETVPQPGRGVVAGVRASF